jgi:hypothetical protein
VALDVPPSDPRSTTVYDCAVATAATRHRRKQYTGETGFMALVHLKALNKRSGGGTDRDSW